MKYFTKEWCFGDLEDLVIEEILKRYREYIDKIYGELPFVLKLLAKKLNLHDGILKKINFSQQKRTLIMEGIFGDLQVGYFYLEIRYSNVSPLEIEVLVSVFKDQEIEILSDEIEVISKKKYSHKLLFSTKKEIEVRFANIEILISNASQENYKREPCCLKII